ncbi:MAG: contractile injection system tape measure protein [Bacteroidota bacterium]
MITQQHTIQKITLNLALTGDYATAFQLKNEVKAMFLEQVNREWEDLFSASVSSDQVLRIPKLELTLGTIHRKEFKKKLLQELQNQLQQINTQDSEAHHQSDNANVSVDSNLVAQLSEKEGLIQSFFHFIQNGVFPWWAKETSWSEWELSVKNYFEGHADKTILAKVKALLHQNENYLNRLCWQFSTDFLQILIQQIEKHQEIKKENTLFDASWNATDFTSFSKSDLKVYLKKWLVDKQVAMSYNSPNSTETITKKVAATTQESTTLQNPSQNTFEKQSFLKEEGKVQTKTAISATPEASVSAARQSESAVSSHQSFFPISIAEADYFYINNAGLAIITPFLPHLFEQLHLLNENRLFRNEQAQLKAIFALQYIAFGATEYPEHELFFNKLICAYPLDESLPKDISLTPKEQTTIETFLKEVIQEWGALKNTSPDGLRYNFLARNGKLSRKSDHWLLQVETMAYDDILLGKLPWTISMLKNKWMDKRINVEWVN